MSKFNGTLEVGKKYRTASGALCGMVAPWV